MGEVYRARDTRLGSTSLQDSSPAIFPTNNMKQRVEREAKAIPPEPSAHLHRGIDVGHQDGHEFLVLEYLEGETLANYWRKAPCARQVLSTVWNRRCVDRHPRQESFIRDRSPATSCSQSLAQKLVGSWPGESGGALAGETYDCWATRTDTGHAAKARCVALPVHVAEQNRMAENLDGRSGYLSLGAVLYEHATGQLRVSGEEQLSVRNPRHT